MAAVDPQGDQKYWFFGLPFDGAKNGTKDMGEIKYWFFGLPGTPLFPTAAAPPGPGTSAAYRLTLLGVG